MESARDLQILLNILSEALGGVGLRINLVKSFTVTWLKNKKAKKIIFDDSSHILVYNQRIPSIHVDEEFKYLGASFIASGLTKI